MKNIASLTFIGALFDSNESSLSYCTIESNQNAG